MRGRLTTVSGLVARHACLIMSLAAWILFFSLFEASQPFKSIYELYRIYFIAGWIYVYAILSLLWGASSRWSTEGTFESLCITPCRSTSWQTTLTVETFEKAPKQHTRFP